MNESTHSAAYPVPTVDGQPVPVGIIGATGYVGQRFMTLLAEHPWFKVKKIAASPRSTGKRYRDAVDSRWALEVPCPETLADMVLEDITDPRHFAEGLAMVFCAVDMPKAEIVALEEALARAEVIVVSNNSANRHQPDVPLLIPEVNGDHVQVITQQRKRLGTTHGFIVCKPNCSIQSFVPALDRLKTFGLQSTMVSTYQAISGAGKTFGTWPEMKGNVIPYIGGEEAKTETEPLKIWGEATDHGIVPAQQPIISAQCYRVAVQEGHMVAISVKFDQKPSRAEILEAWQSTDSDADLERLPSAPSPLIVVHDEDDRPQPMRDLSGVGGMAIHVGRLREDPLFDWKFTCLSHNTLRGAAGGGVLTGEYLLRLGYVDQVKG